MPRDFYVLFNDLQKNVDRITELNKIATSIENINGEKEFLSNEIENLSQKMLFKKVTSFSEDTEIDTDETVSITSQNIIKSIK